MESFIQEGFIYLQDPKEVLYILWFCSFVKSYLTFDIPETFKRIVFNRFGKSQTYNLAEYHVCCMCR